MNIDERWQEVALVDIAYEVLNSSTKSMNYRDIFKEAASMKGLTDEELLDLLPQVFTEMNLDGRFLCISPSEWGLKKWYTTQAIEESIEALARSKGIDDDDDAYGYEDEDDSETDYSNDGDYDTIDDEIDEVDEEEEGLDEIEEDDEELDEGLEVDEDFEEDDSDFESDDSGNDDHEDED
ncbi:MAG TPA: DNA-directed RNA polymerase subunit delta [Bacillota bacterium]|nr:DNA-directed RNA polymerase subunit delta [Bacillota bacterium]